jgi:hypothetical protein
MEGMLSPDYRWLWSIALAFALFFPVRQMIWVLAVRRLQRRTGQLPDEKMQKSLKGRATVTSGLLCLVFAAVYGGVLFGGNL